MVSKNKIYALENWPKQKVKCRCKLSEHYYSMIPFLGGRYIWFCGQCDEFWERNATEKGRMSFTEYVFIENCLVNGIIKIMKCT